MPHNIDAVMGVLRENGLSIPQVGTMQLVRARGAQTVSGISEHLSLSLGATSHLVDRLVQKGLVAREEDPTDRRQKLVSLQPAGRRVVEELDRRSAASLEDLLQGVSERKRNALYKAVAAVVDDVVSHPD